jgi:phosphate-selective porin
MIHKTRLALLSLSLGLLAPTVSADVVQGIVRPAGAKVVVRDQAGNVVTELASGPFQLRLPAGQFVAQCTTATQKQFTFFSLSVPTSIAIDCT